MRSLLDELRVLRMKIMCRLRDHPKDLVLTNYDRPGPGGGLELVPAGIVRTCRCGRCHHLEPTEA